MKEKIALKQYSVKLLEEILNVNNQIKFFELSREQNYLVDAVIIHASIWFEYYVLDYHILKDGEKSGSWLTGYACGYLGMNDKQIESIFKDIAIIDNKIHYMLDNDNIDLASVPSNYIDEIGFYLYKAAIEQISELIFEEYINNYQAKELILYYYKDILKKVIKSYFLLNEKYIIE